MKAWINIPPNLAKQYYVLLPLILAQILQRLYLMVDSRYATELGQQALLIHSVQYNFIAFGQLIGAATAISCLIFWRRKEDYLKQGSIFTKHLVLTTCFCLLVAIPSTFFAKAIVIAYKIDPNFAKIGCIYLWIGLINMILQAVFGSLDGMLIASGQQRKSMAISLLLVLCKVVFDIYAVDILFTMPASPTSIYSPLLIIGLSNTALLCCACFVSGYLVVKKVEGWEKFSFKEMISVWSSEIGVYFIRGVIPFFYAYQLALLIVSPGFFATYQLVFHLSYIFCLPLIAAMQIAVREASLHISNINQSIRTSVPLWWNNLFYTGLLPTIIMLLMGSIFYSFMLKVVYNYVPPKDHLPFIPLYFLACILGQIGTALTISIRARKASYLVTASFFINQIVILLGCTQLLIIFHLGTPRTIGWLMIFYCTSQVIMNAGSIKFLLKKERKNDLVCE